MKEQPIVWSKPQKQASKVMGLTAVFCFLVMLTFSILNASGINIIDLGKKGWADTIFTAFWIVYAFCIGVVIEMLFTIMTSEGKE